MRLEPLQAIHYRLIQLVLDRHFGGVVWNVKFQIYKSGYETEIGKRRESSLKAHVLLTEHISQVGIDMLEKAAKVTIAPSPTDSDLLPLVRAADALIIRSTNLS